ncbi:hypothetical protein HOP50_11g64660 [Chloropicon primus]|uniref:Ankyrin repeat domain-containing protein n=1 Tax=Chloropicon primus TaxID=1764295 RepID=A0A5B8MT14_9CHLO|nr:hypothetical protein A3770_11p64460 [Chloropicon primus]UPR03139.1 hypothetical protein HOP50_11g64660 [Chloropicon primus]|eukprot:QDZ23928.1 hypothetical protein A3770_11p64460 [Chloropicon primus]
MVAARKKQKTEAPPKHALEVLPEPLWRIVGKHVTDYDRVAFASTCRTFLEALVEAGDPRKKGPLPLRTSLMDHKLMEQMPCFTLDWFQWVYHSFERKEGAAASQRFGSYSNHLYDADLLLVATFQGSKKAMKWLASQGIPLSIKCLRHETEEAVALAAAAAGGHVDVLDWLRSEGCKLDESAYAGASCGGQLEVLQWLRSQNPPCPWNENACSYSAYEGHLHNLQWLRSQDPPCPWNESTCAFAATGGRLGALQWLRSQDPPCPWDAKTCQHAAGGGELGVLKWARSQDPPCPWDVTTCSGAAWGGHLDVLKWLRSQDPPCPWDNGTSFYAASGGHLVALQWLQSQDPPCPWNPENCKKEAESMGHQHVVEWIKETNSKQ